MRPKFLHTNFLEFKVLFLLFVQVPSRETDKDPKKFWSQWNKDTKQVIFMLLL